MYGQDSPGRPVSHDDIHELYRPEYLLLQPSSTISATDDRQKGNSTGKVSPQPNDYPSINASFPGNLGIHSPQEVNINDTDFHFIQHHTNNQDKIVDHFSSDNLHTLLPTPSVDDIPGPIPDVLPGQNADLSSASSPDVLPGPSPDESTQPLPGLNPDASPGLIPVTLPGPLPDEHRPIYRATQPPVNANSDSCTGSNYTNEAIQRSATLINTLWPSTHESAESSHPQFCELYKAVKKCNLPNFLGARIPLPSGLKIQSWYKYLKDYHDMYLCEFLNFGWPLGYNLDDPPATTDANHPSATAHPKAVMDFITTELKYDAMVGPFTTQPFKEWFRISPLMTRAKKGSNERRIIVDLSFPHHASVNDGIEPSSHLGLNITYTLPTISDLITQLQMNGKGAFFWKADLKRAYRQIRIDPLDSPFLGIQVDSEIYIDKCPPFGCRSSASICQRMANGLVYIMAKDNFNIMAYLDDFGGCHPSYQQALAAYNRFLQLADELGLELASHKCSPPTTSIEWLGYRVNSLQMSVTIPTEKLQDVIEECGNWLHRDRASKRMIQAIIGKLIFISNCVYPGRKFLARILRTLSYMRDNTWTTISNEFKADIKWFHRYATMANGVFLCPLARPTLEIECDSSLQAGGGHTKGFYYAWKYNKAHMENYPNICQLEAINLLVAYKTLAPALKHLQLWSLYGLITSHQATPSIRAEQKITYWHPAPGSFGSKPP